MARLKNTRTVTYRKGGIPAVILEGKWLTRIYGWEIGEQIGVDFLPREIRLKNIDAEIANDLDIERSIKKTNGLPEGSP